MTVDETSKIAAFEGKKLTSEGVTETYEKIVQLKMPFTLRSAWAAAVDEAGFCPVIRRPSDRFLPAGLPFSWDSY